MSLAGTRSSVFVEVEARAPLRSRRSSTASAARSAAGDACSHRLRDLRAARDARQCGSRRPRSRVCRSARARMRGDALAPATRAPRRCGPRRRCRTRPSRPRAGRPRRCASRSGAHSRVRNSRQRRSTLSTSSARAPIRSTRSSCAPCSSTSAMPVERVRAARRGRGSRSTSRGRAPSTGVGAEQARVRAGRGAVHGPLLGFEVARVGEAGNRGIAGLVPGDRVLRRAGSRPRRARRPAATACGPTRARGASRRGHISSARRSSAGVTRSRSSGSGGLLLTRMRTYLRGAPVASVTVGRVPSTPQGPIPRSRPMAVAAGAHRSRDRRHHRPRARTPEHDDPADRVRELHLARGPRGAGLGPHQQVLRGLPGEALLRRQLRRRRGRGAGAHAGAVAVRRRARQRAAALRRQREPGRVHGAARTGRQGHGHAPRPGRPPHARLAGELQRPPLRLRRVRRRRRDRDARLRRRSATSRCASARG